MTISNLSSSTCSVSQCMDVICSICLGSSAERARCTLCGGEFCDACILHWRTVSPQATCPLCRAELEVVKVFQDTTAERTSFSQSCHALNLSNGFVKQSDIFCAFCFMHQEVILLKMQQQELLQIESSEGRLQQLAREARTLAESVLEEVQASLHLHISHEEIEKRNICMGLAKFSQMLNCTIAHINFAIHRLEGTKHGFTTSRALRR